MDMNASESQNLMKEVVEAKKKYGKMNCARNSLQCRESVEGNLFNKSTCTIVTVVSIQSCDHGHLWSNSFSDRLPPSWHAGSRNGSGVSVQTTGAIQICNLVRRMSGTSSSVRCSNASRPILERRQCPPYRVSGLRLLRESWLITALG